MFSNNVNHEMVGCLRPPKICTVYAYDPHNVLSTVQINLKKDPDCVQKPRKTVTWDTHVEIFTEIKTVTWNTHVEVFIIPSRIFIKSLKTVLTRALTR